MKIIQKSLFAGLALLLIFTIGCAKPSECPACEQKECPKVECKPTEITKYVCTDNSVVDNKDDCGKAATDILYNPVTTNEEGSYINSVTMKPGCYRGVNAAMINFDMGVLADNINIQAKENPSEEFKTIYTTKGVARGIGIYAVICDGCKSGDMQLGKKKQYLVRVEFNLTSLFNKMQYSNEHVIDTRETSDYMKKVCSD